jgi:hypothetical protein
VTSEPSIVVIPALRFRSLQIALGKPEAASPKAA